MYFKHVLTVFRIKYVQSRLYIFDSRDNTYILEMHFSMLNFSVLSKLLRNVLIYLTKSTSQPHESVKFKKFEISQKVHDVDNRLKHKRVTHIDFWSVYQVLLG